MECILYVGTEGTHPVFMQFNFGENRGGVFGKDSQINNCSAQMMGHPLLEQRWAGTLLEPMQLHKSSELRGASNSVNPAPSHAPNQGSLAVGAIGDGPIRVSSRTPVGVPAIQ